MEEILEEVNKILESRESAYGPPDACFKRIAQYWTTYLEYQVNPAQVADLMILMKIAREQAHHKHDNYVDIIGYAVHGDSIRKKELEGSFKHSNPITYEDYKKSTCVTEKMIRNNYGNIAKQLIRKPATYKEQPND